MFQLAGAILTDDFLRPEKLTLYTDKPLYDLVVDGNLHQVSANIKSSEGWKIGSESRRYISKGWNFSRQFFQPLPLLCVPLLVAVCK